jgi:hypothetical protein
MKLIKVVEEESMHKDEFTVEPDHYINRYLLVKMSEDEYHDFYEWKHRVTSLSEPNYKKYDIKLL